MFDEVHFLSVTFLLIKSYVINADSFLKKGG